MVNHIYLIALMPFAMAFLIMAIGRWLPGRGALLSIAAVAWSLMHSIDIFLRFSDGSLKVPFEPAWSWFSLKVYEFNWEFLIDGLSILMALVVCGVSLIVQIYSLGYMPETARRKNYFAYLSLFTSGMLLVVLSNNYLQLFVGWELMGLCSYLLIGFDIDREAAGFAANKAFLTTRIGDLGFYGAILLIYLTCGTLNFGQIPEQLSNPALAGWTVTAIALLLFCGVIGKSAQFPLHVWLPDAMEGPTPVSALIHSATMVAAGIYLTARSYMFFAASPQALQVVAWVGGGTALFSALLALATTDIKKTLAFSTISQLGFMLLSLGVGGYSAGLMHMVTHAVFKALLFLAAGSIIHAVHTNDVWKMGSLSKQMALTFAVFFFGAFALAGVPPFAGFFSKDRILESLYVSGHHGLLVLAYGVSALTAFYVARLMALIFLGEPRERDRFAHAHESPIIMTLPMGFLAFLALVSGWVLSHPDTFHAFFAGPGLAETAEAPHWVAYAAVSAAFLGLVLGFSMYTGPLSRIVRLARAFAPFYRFLAHEAYLNEFYERVILKPVRQLSFALDWADGNVLDRFFVDGWKTLIDQGRKIPSSGRIQGYLMVVALGVMFLLLWNLQ